MIEVLKKVWNFAGDEKSYLRASVIADFLSAIFHMLQFVAIYFLVDAVVIQDYTWKTIVITSLCLLGSVIGIIAMKRRSMLQQTHAGYFMAADKRIEIGEKIKRVPMGFFSEFSLGRLTTIATTDLDNLETWIPTLFIMVFNGLLKTAVFVLALFTLNSRIGLIAIVGSAIFLLVTSLMQKKSKSNADRIHEVQSSLTSEVLATLQGIQVVKSYNLEGENNKKLDRAIDKTKDAMFGLEKSIIPYTVLQRLVIAVTIALMIFTAVKLFFDGGLLPAQAVMLTISSFVIFDGLVSSGSAMAMLRIVENAIESYRYVYRIPDMKEGTVNSPIKNHDIEFNHVSFSYDNRPILKDISCAITENSFTAIVGPSGSGKTTFCNLIARFWDVDSGQINIGGKNIRDYTIENLMDAISMVFQNIYLFEDTIENNIKFGKEDATKEEIIAAAKKAQCHDFIMQLPEQYQTRIGEGGANLSGGEKQRISIARAMLKDAPIIIFDEATANIDPENEDKLKSAIESLTANKTVIMIAHRLKTIRNADQILVLKDGKIVQRGKHEQLMSEGGLYRDLIDAKYKSERWKLNN